MGHGGVGQESLGGAVFVPGMQGRGQGSQHQSRKAGHGDREGQSRGHSRARSRPREGVTCP